MTDEMAPALARLQAKLQTQLDQVKKTKSAINALHEAFDQPAPYADVAEDSVVRGTTIRRGMFYGQPLATCVRNILDMRRTAQLDAASVNEIYAALREGGYAFETKDDENAKNGLRQSLRKNPVFHRIPSGEWGLLEWFPNAKAEKDDDGNGAAPAAKATAKKKSGDSPAVGDDADGASGNEKAASST